MKISKDKVGKNIRLRTRYGRFVEGKLESVKNGVLTIRQNIGSSAEWELGGLTTMLEGQVVAIEEVADKGKDQ